MRTEIFRRASHALHIFECCTKTMRLTLSNETQWREPKSVYFPHTKSTHTAYIGLSRVFTILSCDRKKMLDSVKCLLQMKILFIVFPTLYFSNWKTVYNSDYLSGLSINEPNSPNQIFLFQWKIIRNRCNYVENHVKLCLRIGLFVWGRKISFCASNYDFSRFIFSCRTNFPFLCQQAAVMWIYEFMTNLGTLGKSKNINEGKFRKAILKMDENSNSIILINLIFLIPRPHIQSTLVSLMSESSRFMDFPYDFMNNVMLCAFEQSE